MSESQTTSRFFRFLTRLRSSRPVTDEDAHSVASLPETPAVRREEQEIERGENEDCGVFSRTGFPAYETVDEGLQTFGWKLIPGGPEIKGGAYAEIHLAYKLSESRQKVPLECRHLAICKVQQLAQMPEVYKEVNVLRGLIHENVIDFYGVFKCLEDMSMWILLEYANAGDMEKELKRYPRRCLEEASARYYLQQICAGASYLHEKEVAHNDLHAGNVLLKYNRDGTKTCMLCDFGVAIIFFHQQHRKDRFEKDVKCIRKIAEQMMRGLPHISNDARMLIDYLEYPCYTISRLLMTAWFQGPVVPPIPKSPTPLLKKPLVKKIGYLPQVHKSGLGPEVEETEVEVRTEGSPEATTSSRQKSSDTTSSPERSVERSTFIQRTRKAIRNIPRELRSRMRSRTVEDATGEEEAVEESVPGLAHHQHLQPPTASSVSRGRNVSPQAVSPSSPHRHREESPAVGQSLGSRMRSRFRSLGQTVTRPFRRPSNQPPDQ